MFEQSDQPEKFGAFGSTTTIGLEGVRFHAPIGFYPEEQKTGNDFIIDAFVRTDVTGAAYSDDLGGTVNYQTIYWLLQAEVKKPAQLIEAVAQRIVDRIQNQFPQVSGVKLKVTKLHPPVGGAVAAASVEIRTGSFQEGGGLGLSRFGFGRDLPDKDDKDSKSVGKIDWDRLGLGKDFSE